MRGWQSKAAFVVQFREGADFDTGQIEGKVEHIASYRAARFHSVEELIAFMNRVLADIRDTDRAETQGADERNQFGSSNDDSHER